MVLIDLEVKFYAKYENDKLTACVEIENKGERLAEESVLIYIRDEVASVPQPVKKLVAVKKITVGAKETKKACLSTIFTKSDA